MTPKIFGPSNWNYRVAVYCVEEDCEVASLGWATKSFVFEYVNFERPIRLTNIK